MTLGGKGRRKKKDGEEGEKRARERSMPLQSRVITVRRFKGIYTVTPLSSGKGQTQNTITQ